MPVFWYLRRPIASILFIISLMLPFQSWALSIGEERLIGQKILYSMRQELHILDDPDISQYINTLGKSVLTVAGPQYFDYHFFVVQSDEFNAFAAPGGMVFFYSGLIEAMHNENELVSVLAHEIGHITSRHLAQRLDKGTKVSVASILVGLAGLALGVPGLSMGIFTGSLAAGQAINLQYSREDEEQADRLSFAWMEQMHRDPLSMHEMLETMRRISRYRSDALPQYMLTHPNPEMRLSYVESLLELSKGKKEAPTFQPTDNFAFLRFRYRVLVQTSDQGRLRQYCNITLASDKNPDARHMANYGLALLEAANHRFDKALELLTVVQGYYPTKEILKVDQAVVLLLNGRPAEAKTLLEAAYHRDPTDMYAAFQLGKAEALSGNNTRAQQLFLQVAKAMPDYSQVYFELGQIAANQRQNGNSTFYLAKFNLYEGKEKQAIQLLRQVKKDPSVSQKLKDEAILILKELEQIKKDL